MAERYVPGRGDLIWIDFQPQTGHEQSGRRPVIVLSPLLYNAKVGLALCCPITSKEKGYPFEVPLPAGQVVSGVILADQVKSLDWKIRRAEKIGTLPPAVVNDVLAKINTLLS